MVKPAVRHSAAEVWEALNDVKDPEIPVLSLVELNVVRDVEVNDDTVRVAMVPTFAGCPAMDLMRREVEERLRELGFARVEIDVLRSASWSTDLLTEEAREKLREFGIAAPPYKLEQLQATLALPVSCPFCASEDTRLESPFGPTLCKQIFYCHACRQSFERFKPL